MYMRAAEVRIFLPAAPIGGPDRTWADVALTYVEAFVQTKLTILCLAISRNADLQIDSPWYPVRGYFLGGLKDRYVNVVIGVNPTRHVRLADGAESHMPELERLFTVGVPNVALIGGGPRDLDAIEREALRNYDAIITPTEEDLHSIAEQVPGHASILHIPATDPAALENLMRNLLGKP